MLTCDKCGRATLQPDAYVCGWCGVRFKRLGGAADLSDRDDEIRNVITQLLRKVGVEARDIILDEVTKEFTPSVRRRSDVLRDDGVSTLPGGNTGPTEEEPSHG